MKAITLFLCTSWTTLLIVHELLAAGEGSLCNEEGLFPRSDHCRLLVLCLKSKSQSSRWKEYLLNCPFGLNFNHFMMSCYNFKQECAQERGLETDRKLANSWSLTLPRQTVHCNGTKAPFCIDDKNLTICHPYSKKVLGYVNCKEKDPKRSYCDRKEGICKRGTPPTSPSIPKPNNTNVPDDGDNESNGGNGDKEVTEITGANYLQVVVLCSASLKESDRKRCVELFGCEYECLAREDRCPVYVAELISIADGTAQHSVEASIHIYASMGNMNVKTVVGRPANGSVIQNQCDGDIINGAMKLQKCKKAGGNCLSDGDTIMDCHKSLRIKHVYSCSAVFGKSYECVPKLQECVVLEERKSIAEGNSDMRMRFGGYDSERKDESLEDSHEDDDDDDDQQ